MAGDLPFGAALLSHQGTTADHIEIAQKRDYSRS
jgi:hypothetical protein